MQRAFMYLFVVFLAMLASCGDSTPSKGDTQEEADIGIDEPAADIPFEPGPDQEEEILGDTPPDTPADVPVEPGPEVPPDVHYDVEPDEQQDIPHDEQPDLPYDMVVDVIIDIEPDMPFDIPYDFTCVGQGCLVSPAGRCCPGLTPATECDPSSGDPECSNRYCIDCGNGICDPHENCYNCIMDCTTPCPAGTAVSYNCSLIETHYCNCNTDACIPACQTSPDGGLGWFDPCTGALIRADRDCTGQTAVCDAVCSRSEGWYESGTGELIAWDFCSNTWQCSIVW